MVINVTMPFDIILYSRIISKSCIIGKWSDDFLLRQYYFYVHFNKGYSTFP